MSQIITYPKLFQIPQVPEVRLSLSSSVLCHALPLLGGSNFPYQEHFMVRTVTGRGFFPCFSRIMETRTGTWVVSRASPGSRFRRLLGFTTRQLFQVTRTVRLSLMKDLDRAMCGDVVEAMKKGYVGVSNMWTNDHGTKRGTNSESHVVSRVPSTVVFAFMYKFCPKYRCHAPEKSMP